MLINYNHCLRGGNDGAHWFGIHRNWMLPLLTEVHYALEHYFEVVFEGQDIPKWYYLLGEGNERARRKVRESMTYKALQETDIDEQEFHETLLSQVASVIRNFAAHVEPAWTLDKDTIKDKSPFHGDGAIDLEYNKTIVLPIYMGLLQLEADTLTYLRLTEEHLK